MKKYKWITPPGDIWLDGHQRHRNAFIKSGHLEAILPKLEPCCYCGFEAFLSDGGDFEICYVFCSQCQARGPQMTSPEKALQEWNIAMRTIKANTLDRNKIKQAMED